MSGPWPCPTERACAEWRCYDSARSHIAARVDSQLKPEKLPKSLISDAPVEIVPDSCPNFRARKVVLESAWIKIKAGSATRAEKIVQFFHPKKLAVFVRR